MATAAFRVSRGDKGFRMTDLEGLLVLFSFLQGRAGPVAYRRSKGGVNTVGKLCFHVHVAARMSFAPAH